jgi:hypothetical protein
MFGSIPRKSWPQSYLPGIKHSKGTFPINHKSMIFPIQSFLSSIYDYQPLTGLKVIELARPEVVVVPPPLPTSIGSDGSCSTLRRKMHCARGERLLQASLQATDFPEEHASLIVAVSRIVGNYMSYHELSIVIVILPFLLTRLRQDVSPTVQRISPSRHWIRRQYPSLRFWMSYDERQVGHSVVDGMIQRGVGPFARDILHLRKSTLAAA